MKVRNLLDPRVQKGDQGPEGGVGDCNAPIAGGDFSVASINEACFDCGPVEQRIGTVCLGIHREAYKRPALGMGDDCGQNLEAYESCCYAT